MGPYASSLYFLFLVRVKHTAPQTHIPTPPTWSILTTLRRSFYAPISQCPLYFTEVPTFFLTRDKPVKNQMTLKVKNTFHFNFLLHLLLFCSSSYLFFGTRSYSCYWSRLYHIFRNCGISLQQSTRWKWYLFH